MYEKLLRYSFRNTNGVSYNHLNSLKVVKTTSDLHNSYIFPPVNSTFLMLNGWWGMFNKT